MTTYENHLEQVEGLLDAIAKFATRQCNKAMAIDALSHVIRAKKILSQYKEGLITAVEAGFSAPKQPVETKTRHKDRRYNQIKDFKEIYCTCGKSKLCDVKCSACGKIAFTD